MQRRYVDFNNIIENPAKYSNRWVQSCAKLRTGSHYSTHSGGGKYLFDLLTPDDQKVILALWEAPPSWIPYPETSEYLLKIVSGKEGEEQQILRLFQPGEMVFFEGYLLFQNGITWINIERILIASPDTAIGPREIIGMMSCPRKYYLDYIKNVGGNILKRPNKNITRGNLIHEILENVACDGSLQSLSSCTYGEKKDRIKILLGDQLKGKYRMDAALHVLANTPLFDVEKDVTNRLTSAFGDEELSSLYQHWAQSVSEDKKIQENHLQFTEKNSEKDLIIERVKILDRKQIEYEMKAERYSEEAIAIANPVVISEETDPEEQEQTREREQEQKEEFEAELAEEEAKEKEDENNKEA